MWAALRHRRGQVIALALVSALVATCAVFAPVFARSIDQALLKVHVSEADPAVVATSISRGRTSEERTVMPADVLEDVPKELTSVSGEPILTMRQGADVVPTEGKKASPVVLRSRSDACDHLDVSGRCPSAAGEILVSGADAKAWGWRAGTTLSIPQKKYTRFEADPPPVRLTVVGTYEVRDDPTYWLGDLPDGKSGVPQPDLDNLPGVDDFITSEQTFADALTSAAAGVALPLDPDAATLDSMPRAAASADRLAEEHPEMEVDESARSLVDGVSTGRQQTAIIVPFVMLQLALLSVLVLFLVAQACVDQRRHDVALARLRGRSRTGARRLLLRELTLPVLLGLPVGIVCALGLAVIVRRSMLPAGIPFEVPLAVLPWLIGSLVISVLAVYLAARPVLREPVNDLLRSVSPGRAGGSVLVDVVVVVLATLGVVGLTTGALSGSGALATPTLLAIAVGVLAARLVPRLAARRARTALRRGRVSAVVAGHGIGRRPAARRVLVVTTVATAVAVFGANAVVVADRNRLARAELETGAPGVVSVRASTATQLMGAADALEDEGITAAPVTVIAPKAQDADATMAVDPASFAEVAHPEMVDGLDLSVLDLPEQKPIRIPGSTATATVTWDLTASGLDEPPVLIADMTTPDGDERSADLLTLGPKAKGRTQIDSDLFCSNGCRLAGLRAASSGDRGSELTGSVTISGLEVDGDPLPVTGEDTWASTGSEGGTGIDVTTKGDTLTLDVAAADGADVSTYVTDVPRPLPAISSAGEAQKGEELQVVDVSGGQTTVRVDEEVSQLPAVTDRGVLLSLPALARLTGQLDTGRVRAQLWISDVSPGAVEHVREVLAEEDLPVSSVTTTDEADRVYDDSASGWGLQLALIGGGLAVLLAGLVLVILAVTGWRATVRDLAALRISGVGRRAVARAVRAEHLVSVAVGVLLGALCALAGSWIALPSIPLFTAPAAVPAAGLAPAWLTVLGATVAVGGVLLLLAWLLSGAVLRRVRLGAARGEPT